MIMDSTQPPHRQQEEPLKHAVWSQLQGRGNVMTDYFNRKIVFFLVVRIVSS